MVVVCRVMPCGLSRSSAGLSTGCLGSSSVWLQAGANWHVHCLNTRLHFEIQCVSIILNRRCLLRHVSIRGWLRLLRLVTGLSSGAVCPDPPPRFGGLVSSRLHDLWVQPQAFTCCFDSRQNGVSQLRRKNFIGLGEPFNCRFMQPQGGSEQPDGLRDCIRLYPKQWCRRQHIMGQNNPGEQKVEFVFIRTLPLWIQGGRVGPFNLCCVFDPPATPCISFCIDIL